MISLCVSTCHWGNGNDLGGVRPTSHAVGIGDGSGGIVIDGFFGVVPPVTCCSGVRGIVVARTGQRSMGLLFG